MNTHYLGGVVYSAMENYCGPIDVVVEVGDSVVENLFTGRPWATPSTSTHDIIGAQELCDSAIELKKTIVQRDPGAAGNGEKL